MHFSRAYIFLLKGELIATFYKNSFNYLWIDENNIFNFTKVLLLAQNLYIFFIAPAVLLLLVPLPSTYSSGIKVFPLDSNPFGLTYSQWLEKYFKWTASIPEEENHPFFDKTGESCATYQNNSHVIFLPDAPSGESVVRECTVDKDKSILINLLHSMCDEKQDREDFVSKPEACVEDGLADTHISLTVDGIPFDGKSQPDINKFKTGPIFSNISYANGNYLSIGGDYTPGKMYKSIIGSYLVMLEPLPVGKHTIAFEVTSTGCTENDPSCSPYHVNVKYNLNVV